MLTVPLTTACVIVGSGVGVSSVKDSLGIGDSGLEMPGLLAVWQPTSVKIARIAVMKCNLDVIVLNGAFHPGTNFTSMFGEYTNFRINYYNQPDVGL